MPSHYPLYEWSTRWADLIEFVEFMWYGVGLKGLASSILGLLGWTCWKVGKIQYSYVKAYVRELEVENGTHEWVRKQICWDFDYWPSEHE